MVIVKWEKKEVDYSKIDFDKRRLGRAGMYVFMVDGVEIGWMIKAEYRAFVQFNNRPLLHLEHDGHFLNSSVVLRDIAIQKQIAFVRRANNKKWFPTMKEIMQFSLCFNDEKGAWKLEQDKFVFIAHVTTSVFSFKMIWDTYLSKSGFFEFEKGVTMDWLFLSIYPLEMCNKSYTESNM